MQVIIQVCTLLSVGVHKINLSALQDHEGLYSEDLKYFRMIFLFIYMTFNLFKEISLQIIFLSCITIHSQTTVHKLLLTSEELQSLC